MRRRAEADSEQLTEWPLSYRRNILGVQVKVFVNG